MSENNNMEIEKSQSDKVEEVFMPSEVLMSSEDRDQWDVLVSHGVRSESKTVCQWDRQSLYRRFDPLVGSQTEKEMFEHEENSAVNHGLLETQKPEFNGDGDVFEFISEPQSTELTLEGHVFAIPQSHKISKLVPVETPPSKLSRPIARINSYTKDVSPSGVEALSELGVTATENQAGDMPQQPSLPNHKKMSGSDEKEAMDLLIKEALAAQEEQFLSELAEKDKMIQELRQTKVKEESAGVFADHNARRLLVEYEKTTTPYLEQLKQLKEKLTGAQVEKLNTEMERDQALEDLRHVEESFILLHQKYERVKGTLPNYRKNEDMLISRDKNLIFDLENQDKKIEAMKEESTNNITAKHQDFQVKYSTLQSENVKLTAHLRKNKMAEETLGQNLEQKQKENVELNKLCEELISGGLNVK